MGSSPIRVAILFCGSSSVVEHHLAKVGVAGPSPVFRSIYQKPTISREPGKSPGLQILRANRFFNSLLESLILAQDERWRRA